MADHLLPPNATKLEIALSETLSRITNIPVPVDTLWNPETCPATHLPWLAWALSVDVWDPAWPEDVKRRMIAASPEIHRLKGTRGAVERALTALGAVAQITEWFEQNPKGTPGTFDVVAYAHEHISGGSVLLTAELQAQMLRAVTHSKPVCRSFGFRAGVSLKDTLGLAGTITPRARGQACLKPVFPLKPSTLGVTGAVAVRRRAGAVLSAVTPKLNAAKQGIAGVLTARARIHMKIEVPA